MEDDLHALIQSLDTSERGYFSKFAARQAGQGDRNYARLFWMMAEMPEYDGAALEQALASMGIATRLAAAKSHLKSMILRAMRSYNSGESVHVRLLEGLHDLAFLYKKRQFDLLRREVNRLKRLAELHGEHPILLQLGDYESRLHKELGHRDIVEGMDSITMEMSRHAEDFQNEFAYLHLYNRMFVVARKAGPDRLQAVDFLMASPLLTHPEEARTLHARIYCYQTLAIGEMVRGQVHVAQRHSEAVVAAWDSAPHLIAESPGTYRRVLNNYLGICAQTDDYSQFPSTLAKIRSTPAKYAAEQAEVFLIGYTAELLWRMGIHDWEAVEVLLPTIEEGLQRHHAWLGPASVLPLRYDGAVCHLLLGNRSACRRWLRAITEPARTEQRMDLQRMARVIGLLLTWMDGDLEHLEYSLRAVQRFIDQLGSNPVETVVLDTVRRLLQARDAEESQQILRSMVDRLSAPDTRYANESLWLRAWAQGQISGRRAWELLRGAD